MDNTEQHSHKPFRLWWDICASIPGFREKHVAWTQANKEAFYYAIGPIIEAFASIYHVRIQAGVVSSGAYAYEIWQRSSGPADWIIKDRKSGHATYRSAMEAAIKKAIELNLFIDQDKENFLKGFNEWEAKVKSLLTNNEKAYYFFELPDMLDMFSKGMDPEQAAAEIKMRVSISLLYPNNNEQPD